MIFEAITYEKYGVIRFDDYWRDYAKASMEINPKDFKRDEK